MGTATTTTKAQSQVKRPDQGIPEGHVVDLGATAVRTTIEIITPEVAAQMLERNTSNRPLSLGVATRYAADMQGGRWDYNGQDILFADTGELLDGQHRLKAVILADMPVRMGIKRGLPKAAFATLDAGNPRKAGDVLAMLGYTNYTQTASAARLALLYATGRPFAGGNASRREVTDFVQAHPFIVDAIKAAHGLRDRVPASPCAAVIFLANERRFFDEAMHDFIKGVQHGEGLVRGDPRLTFREWAFNERLRNRGQIFTGVCFSAFARAWSAWSRGEELKLIKPVAAPSKANVQIVGFSDDVRG